MQERKEYFSDEELEKLIAEVEGKDMLEAPVGMKDRIISKAREKKMLGITKEKGISAKAQLFKYQMKVGIATAAALLILFVVPMEIQIVRNSTSSTESYTRTYQSFTSKIVHKSDRLCEKFFDFTNQLVGKEDIRHEKTEKK